MSTTIKSNIPLSRRDEYGWNRRNVAIHAVSLLALFMLTAYVCGRFELPPITMLALGLAASFFMFDALEGFFPLKTWEVPDVRRPQL